MAFFDLFSKKKERPAKPGYLANEFTENVKKAIGLTQEHSELDDPELLQLYLKNGIPSEDAIAIWFFLPVAFVRRLMPNLQWHDTYVLVKLDKSMVRMRYDETTSYCFIYAVTDEYFESLPGSEAVLKIAGSSASFHGMNELLQKHSEYGPGDIIFTETYFRMPELLEQQVTSL